jgi:hypothetical protein
MYKLEDDASPLYRKIGRTERLPERRVKEWSGNAVLIQSWRCRRNRYAEAIIHQLLSTVRLYRHQVSSFFLLLLFVVVVSKPLKKVYLTMNTHTGLFVQDTAYQWVVNQVDENAKKAATKRSKNIEWFIINDDAAFEVIRTVVTAINAHYEEDEPWTEHMQPFM